MIGDCNLGGLAAPLERTVQELKRMGFDTIVPCHCTGKKRFVSAATPAGLCSRMRVGQVAAFGGGA